MGDSKEFCFTPPGRYKLSLARCYPAGFELAKLLKKTSPLLSSLQVRMNQVFHHPAVLCQALRIAILLGLS
jgi:hypothetical protein